MEYILLKWIHVLSSTILFGTGIGSAFYMLLTSLGRDAKVIAPVVRLVVRADWLFTTPAIVIQPLTGFLMMRAVGLDMSSRWISLSIALYVLAGASWLPVVGMQIRMRDLAVKAAATNAAMPDAYYRLLRWWIALGCIAFAALVAVFYLMVAKPV
jgi:uncharacterized membrane protein